MRPLRLSPVPIAVLLLALAGTGCFSEAPPAPGPVAPQTAAVVAGSTANTFSPSLVTIARGGTVTWTIGTRNHNVTFFGNATAPANIPTGTNLTQSRTFTTAGTYPYNCTLHAGMTGQVVVQ